MSRPQNFVTTPDVPAHGLPGVDSILNTPDSAHTIAVATNVLTIFQICGLGVVSFMGIRYLGKISEYGLGRWLIR